MPGSPRQSSGNDVSLITTSQCQLVEHVLWMILIKGEAWWFFGPHWWSSGWHRMNICFRQKSNLVLPNFSCLVHHNRDMDNSSFLWLGAIQRTDRFGKHRLQNIQDYCLTNSASSIFRKFARSFIDTHNGITNPLFLQWLCKCIQVWLLKTSAHSLYWQSPKPEFSVIHKVHYSKEIVQLTRCGHRQVGLTQNKQPAFSESLPFWSRAQHGLTRLNYLTCSWPHLCVFRWIHRTFIFLKLVVVVLVTKLMSHKCWIDF